MANTVMTKKDNVENDYTEDEELMTLIPELCSQFYHMGWMTGTGGAMSIRGSTGRIYVTPSGLQKERMKASDLFACDDDGNVIAGPMDKSLKISSCAGLFMLAHKHRGAGAAMHTHSKAAFIASVVFPGKEIKLTHMQSIRGIRNDVTGKSHGYEDELIIPIIENRPAEALLLEPLEQAMKEYPETCCVLVRRHGIYAWSESWQRTKVICECLDYLFEMAVKMKDHGVDPSKKPN